MKLENLFENPNQDQVAGIRRLKSRLGGQGGSVTVLGQAMEKLVNGEMLRPNEREALKPIAKSFVDILNHSQGAQQLDNLHKRLSGNTMRDVNKNQDLDEPAVFRQNPGQSRKDLGFEENTKDPESKGDCEYCLGSGMVTGGKTCPRCDGDGEEPGYGGTKAYEDAVEEDFGYGYNDDKSETPIEKDVSVTITTTADDKGELQDILRLAGINLPLDQLDNPQAEIDVCPDCGGAECGCDSEVSCGDEEPQRAPSVLVKPSYDTDKQVLVNYIKDQIKNRLY